MTEKYHQLPIQIRFSDVDSFGHVNNNAYFSFYDLGKQEFFNDVLPGNFTKQDVVPVIANIQADFLLPIFYGDKVVVETRVGHLGEKSFMLEQQAVSLDGTKVYCRCNTILVCFSQSEKKTVSIPDDYRTAFETYEPRPHTF